MNAIKIWILALCIMIIPAFLNADSYFIATDGNDDNPGTFELPFATFEHAIGMAQPGDTIFVRGGLYMLDTPVVINKTGTSSNMIYLWAYGGEKPVLDFQNNPRHANPPQPRDDDSIEATSDALGVFVAPDCDWWHVKGLTIQDAPYYGVRVYSSNHIFEELILIDNQASGLEITGKEGHIPGYNLVLNCDSYLNFDPQTNGEDADGFAAKFESLGPGNVFSGLRAWSNSDDGYDFWHATHPVIIENCWSFDNGFFRPEWEPEVNGSWRGDGLGFKLGQDASELVLNHNVAFGNKAFGIDANGNNSTGGVTINNATLVNNAKNGNPLQIKLTDGSPHTVRNCIAFDVDGSGVTNLGGSVDHSYNTWNGIGVSAADFVDIDMETLYEDATAPRNSDGSPPEIGLRLAPDSDLIDSGIDVGLPYNGPAPDLGAFETVVVSVAENLPSNKAGAFQVKISPNPFVDYADIRIITDNPDNLKVRVVDLSGRLIRNLTVENKNAAECTFTWKRLDEYGSRVKPGFYFLHISDGNQQTTERLIVK